MSPDVKLEPIAELIGLMDAPYKEMIGAGLDPDINPNLTPNFSKFSQAKEDLYKELANVIGEMWLEVRAGIESHPQSRGLIEQAVFRFDGDHFINESTFLTEEQVKQIISESDKPERVARSISIYIQATIINNFNLAELKSGESVEDPAEDKFHIASKTLQDANLPNHAGRDVSYDLSRLVSNGANTAVSAYQDFVTVAFQVAKRDKNLFPEMTKEEFENLVESVMTIPIKISSKHGNVLSQLNALRMEDPFYNFGKVLNPDFFILTNTNKGYRIKLSEAGKNALKENSRSLKEKGLWSSKKQCPILHAGNHTIAEFHPWIAGIFRDFVIPRLWNFYSES